MARAPTKVNAICRPIRLPDLSSLFKLKNKVMKNMNLRSVCTFAIVIAISFLNSAFAADRIPQPVLEFVGYLNNQPVYRLDMKNPEKIKLVLTIRDTDGMILHEELLEGEKISRKYCFLREEIGNQELIVEVTRSERDAVVGTIRMDRRKMK
jgi:hypothetical protein